MGREEVRDRKRVLRQARRANTDKSGQDAREAALGLLARSIRFRHGRLALLRIADAVALGATPDPEQWRYCCEVALTSDDSALQALYLRAAAACVRPDRAVVGEPVSPVGGLESPSRFLQSP